MPSFDPGLAADDPTFGPESRGVIKLPPTDDQAGLPLKDTEPWQRTADGLTSLTGWLADPVTRRLNQPDATPVAPPNPADGLPNFQIPGLQIISVAGRGGCAIVYKAYQPILERFVAVKVLPPAYAEDPVRLTRLYREAATASQLVHGSVLPVFDLVEYQGTPMIVMPFLDGSTVEQILRDRWNFKQDQEPETLHPWARLNDREYLDKVMAAIDTIVEAVATVHQRGIIHRDIKPANLMVDQDEKVWLTDFGLARVRDAIPFTREGDAHGTRGYMPPEQQSGLLDIDQRTDVFGLGVTIYRVLTLGYPYGSTFILPGSPPPLPPSKRQPLLAPAFDRVLLKALELDRSSRYTDAVEFARDWKAAREGKLLPVPIHRRIARSLKRHAKRWTGGILALSLFAGLGWVMSADDAGMPGPGKVPVQIASAPGASFALIRLDPVTHEIPKVGPPQKLDLRDLVRGKIDRTGKGRVRLVPGDYLVEVGIPDHGFQQVFRRVPAPDESMGFAYNSRSWKRLPDGELLLPAIQVPPLQLNPPEGMAWIEGDNEFQPSWGHAELSKIQPIRGLNSFLLETREVTNAEYARVMGSLPELGIEHRKAHPVKPDDPVTHVTQLEALEFAERTGHRLPTDGELRYIFEGWLDPSPPTIFDFLRPWPCSILPAKTDRTTTAPPVFGLRTGMAEWTQTSAGGIDFERFRMDQLADQRLAFGGTYANIESGLGTYWPDSATYDVSFVAYFLGKPGLSFRRARSTLPLLLDPKEARWFAPERTSGSGSR